MLSMVKALKSWVLSSYMGKDANSCAMVSTAVMAYVSNSTDRFYLSRQVMRELGIIPNDFPKIISVLWMDKCTMLSKKMSYMTQNSCFLGLSWESSKAPINIPK